MKRSKLLATGAVAALMFSPIVAFAADNGHGQGNNSHGQGQGLGILRGHGLGLDHSGKMKADFHMNGKGSFKAGDFNMKAQTNTDGNVSVNTQNTSSNSGQTKAHGNSNNGMNQKAAAQAKHTQHMQAVADLHKAINQLHVNQKLDKAEHQQLIQALHAYIAQVEQAVSMGNTSGLSTAVTQAQQIISTLRQAAKAQLSEMKNAASGATFQKDGHLTNAIQAIDNADARLKQKTQAMKTAVSKLQSVTSALQASNQAFSKQSASGSTSGSTASGSTSASTHTGTKTSAGANTVTSSIVNTVQSTVQATTEDNQTGQNQEQESSKTSTKTSDSQKSSDDNFNLNSNTGAWGMLSGSLLGHSLKGSGNVKFQFNSGD
ncbi:hypothetical protein [Alicyclobacillus sp. SO9]|uniref:hypothetical protein n=1 Tax=Alicyclobacillus sp. SO9 TaxID=2665646 RepID=UPI0018E8EEFB|nr:hypothetical protein [Alicyclobacillus sp. SO9]QQE79108.1 hypothetical protein GI364_00875 [Alicyclobacillus sp. SO9]